MSLEAVPIVYKHRDENGVEVPMFGLLIRPQGGQGNGATSVFPIAPVNGDGQTSGQFQIAQNGHGNTLLQSKSAVCPPALLAAAQSAVANGIPPTKLGSNKSTPMVINLPSNARLLSPTARSAVPNSTTTSRDAKSRARKSTTKSSAGARKAGGQANGSKFTSSHPGDQKLQPASASEAETFAKPRTPPTSSFSSSQPSTSRQQTCGKLATLPSSSSGMPTVSVYNQHSTTTYGHGSELEDLNGIELNQLPAINTEDYQRYLNPPPQLESASNAYCNKQASTSSNFAYSAHHLNPPDHPSSYFANSVSDLHHPPSAIPPRASEHQHPSTSYSYQQPHHLQPQYQNHQQPTVNPHLQQQAAYGQWRGHPNVPTPGSNHLSTSPDSGIQSIDGSPPCTIAFTPPTVSPYFTQSANCGLQDQQQPLCSSGLPNVVLSTHGEDSGDDYSDMPTLIPANQVENFSDAPELAEQPILLRDDAKSDVADGSRATSRADDDKIDLQSMDLAEIANRLMSTLDPEKLKQFTSLIQSKALNTLPANPNDEQSPRASSLAPSSSKTTTARKRLSDPPISLPFSPTISSSKSTTRRPRKRRESSPVCPLAAEICGKRLQAANTQRRGRPGRVQNANARVLPKQRPAVNQTTSEHEEDDEEQVVTGRNETEEDRLRKYRECVQREHSRRLLKVTNLVAEEFSNTRLKLGSRFESGLLWQSPNWSAIDSRLQKRQPTSGNEMFVNSKLTSEFAGQDEEPPVKRGRGRPRTKVIPSTDFSPLSPIPTTLKRTERRSTSRKSKLITTGSKFVYEATSRSNSPNSLKLTIVRKLSTEELQPPPVVPRRRRSKNTQKDEFVKIRSNDLVEAPVRLSEPKKCQCDVSAPCIDENCTNRKSNVECTQSSCKQRACQNRRMTNNEAVQQLQMFETEKRGRAIRTTVDISDGQFICEFVGEVVKTSTYQHRTLLRDDSMPRFGVHLASGFVVDATQRGNNARFINHSCEPNCELQRWLCGGHYRLGIFAKRDIREGEELTFDYGRFVRLEPDQECRCGSQNCKKVISAQATANPMLRPDSLTSRQLKLVRNKNVFLMRNLEKFNRSSPTRHVSPNYKYRELSEFLLTFYEDIAQHAESKERIPHQRITQLTLIMRRLMLMKHKTPEELTVKFDGALKAWITSLNPSYDRRGVDALKSHLVHLKKTRPAPSIEKEAARAFCEDRKRPYIATKRDHRTLPADTNLSYMDEGNPIGSYDHDVQKQKAESNSDADCVRCICGITDEEGEMVQCDECKFWMHGDCIEFDQNNSDEYKCDFCTQQLSRTPAVDVILKPQPKVAFRNCTYYRSLVNKCGIQVRINETVYVKRLINDDYKAMLKEMHEECAQPKKRDCRQRNKTTQPVTQSTSTIATESSRRDVRHFRVERLFLGSDGERFVFGCYYARPHETFCDSSRMFHKNEIFWTPFFDTLPLDAVVGRCLVVDPETWSEGRPKTPIYKEDDVYLCEYQIDRNQRTFTKIPTSNHYYVNKAPYVFQRFPNRKQLKRTFTPFVLEGEVGKTERCEVKDRVNAVNKEICMKRLLNVWTRIAKSKKFKFE